MRRLFLKLDIDHTPKVDTITTLQGVCGVAYGTEALRFISILKVALQSSVAMRLRSCYESVLAEKHDVDESRKAAPKR
jgi:hypothetical protein